MDNQKPRYKKKGPIRFEAIVPFATVVVVLVAYFTLFFDMHLRKGLEFAGYIGNGAEVNIEHLKTSFIHGSLQVDGIQVTNPLEPSKNRLEVGQLQFKFNWDALLRAKFVVELASITDIAVGTTRKEPGKVAPPPTEPSMSAKLLAQAKEKLASSSLGDAAKMLEGVNPAAALKELEGLKSLTYLNSLKADLGKKESEWSQTLEKTIPSQKDLAAQQTRLQALQGANISNPADAVAKVNEAKALISDIDQKINAIKAGGENLVKDVDGFSKAIGQVDEKIKEDRADLEKKLKLPSLDARSLAEQLFGPGLFQKIEQGEHYVALARKYMPPKKAKEAKPEKPARGKGRTYAFGHQNSYPLFWLKKAVISSQGEHSALGGNVTGELRDVATDQSLVGRPAVLQIAGDFPKQNLGGVKVTVTVDRSAEEPVESLQASIASFPVGQTLLSNSESLRFGFNKAVGSTAIEATVRGSDIDLTADHTFNTVDYLVSAQSKPLENILHGVVKDLPKVSVTGKVKGPLNHLEIAVQSNLASALESGFQKQLQAKLAEARKQLDDAIHAKVDGVKKEVTGKFNDTRGKLLAQVEERKKQAEGLKTQAQAKLTQLSNQGSGAQKKAVDAIKKKLPF